MTDTAALIDNYIATWNETDPERRRELVTRTWADDASYVDPLMSSEGHKGIASMIAAAQQQFPQHRFELSLGPDAHNGNVRFATRGLPTSAFDPLQTSRLPRVDVATAAGGGRLTFDMSGRWRQAKPAGSRPLDGGPGGSRQLASMRRNLLAGQMGETQ